MANGYAMRGVIYDCSECASLFCGCPLYRP